MQVLPHCGHCVHEDAPDKVSNLLYDVTQLLLLQGDIKKESKDHLPGFKENPLSTGFQISVILTARMQ